MDDANSRDYAVPLEMTEAQNFFISRIKESKDIDVDMASIAKKLVDKNNTVEAEVIFLTRKLTDALRKTEAATSQEVYYTTAHLKFQDHLRNAMRRGCKAVMMATLERWQSWQMSCRLIRKAQMEVEDEVEIREKAQSDLATIRLGCAIEMAEGKEALQEMQEEVALQGENTVFTKTIQTLQTKLAVMNDLLKRVRPETSQAETQTDESLELLHEQSQTDSQIQLLQNQVFMLAEESDGYRDQLEATASELYVVKNTTGDVAGLKQQLAKAEAEAGEWREKHDHIVGMMKGFRQNLKAAP